MERPDADGVRGDAERRQRRIQPLLELLRRPLVERDAAISSAAAAPDATSHATRATSVVVLPRTRGSDAQDRPGGATAASRWSGASRASRSATDGDSESTTDPMIHGPPYLRLTPRLVRSCTAITSLPSGAFGELVHRP